MAVLLLPAAASVTSVVQGLGPFDSPFESSKTARNNQLLAAGGPAYAKAAQAQALERPRGAALFATDTSGLAENYILYSGLEVLPIGGYLGNVPAPTLAELQADINDGYVEAFLLPVSPSGSDPRVRWIESHCTRVPPRPGSPPRPDANFFCGAVTSQPAAPAPGPATSCITGLDLHRLETQAFPEMGGASAGLVFAAPGGPVKCLVDGLVVFFADEVEQAAGLAEGEADQAPGRQAGSGTIFCAMLSAFWAFCSVSWRWLSTGSGSPFWICVS